MWDHVTLRATDLDASAAFYDTALRTLGTERTSTADRLVEWDQFSLSPANAAKRATRGLHLGFSAPTREHVHAFWQAGVDAGYRDDGEPGLRPEYGSDYYVAFPAADRAAVEAFHRTAVDAGYRDNGAPGERPEYHPGYYGAFVLDPDGNNIEAVFHDRG